MPKLFFKRQSLAGLQMKLTRQNWLVFYSDTIYNITMSIENQQKDPSLYADMVLFVKRAGPQLLMVILDAYRKYGLSLEPERSRLFIYRCINFRLSRRPWPEMEGVELCVDGQDKKLERYYLTAACYFNIKQLQELSQIGLVIPEFSSLTEAQITAKQPFLLGLCGCGHRLTRDTSTQPSPAKSTGAIPTSKRHTTNDASPAKRARNASWHSNMAQDQVVEQRRMRTTCTTQSHSISELRSTSDPRSQRSSEMGELRLNVSGRATTSIQQ